MTKVIYPQQEGEVNIIFYLVVKEGCKIQKSTAITTVKSLVVLKSRSAKGQN